MTKLAHLHFTTNEQASERIRRMGEEPWRVHNVGFPAIDLIAAGKFASPEEVVQRFKLDAARPVVLFCQHSVTTEFDEAGEQVTPSLDAMIALADEGYQIILTYPNNDAGGRVIIDHLKEVAARKHPNIQLHSNLGRNYFHGVLNLIGRVGRGALAGNSSAGIKETPAFGCAAINIGSRQQGRLRALNAVDVGYDAKEIKAAIVRAVNDEAFRRICQTCENPYGVGDAGRKIAEVIATVPLDAKLVQKRMTY
jgi:UDP-hydrolysing UDP-N-acetyl-D-glucosamine 2-epimerase